MTLLLQVKHPQKTTWYNMSGSSKDRILHKIREALRTPIPMPFPNTSAHQTVFHAANEHLSVLFAHQFMALQGHFIYCENEMELQQQFNTLTREKNWQDIYSTEPAFQKMIQSADHDVFTDLENCDVSITGCMHLIARTGTIVMSTAQESGRTASVYAPIHICVAFTNQLVYDLVDALNNPVFSDQKSIPSLITFASGPSRTADIEKTLVTGVHGPKEVYCFLVES